MRSLLAALPALPLLALVSAASAVSAATPETGLKERLPEARCDALAKALKPTSSFSRYSAIINADDANELKLATIGCGETFYGGHGDYALYMQTHRAWNPRRYDAFKAALATLTCAADDDCTKSPVSIGQMYWYAKTLDAAAVDQSVAAVKTDADVKLIFARKVVAAKALIVAAGDALDPRRKELYLSIPMQVRAERDAHLKTYAALYTKLDLLSGRADEAMRASKNDAALAAEVKATRDEFLGKCAAEKGQTTETCIAGPLGRSLTNLLVKIGIAGSDATLAVAEQELVKDTVDTEDLAASIQIAQARAIDDEVKRWDDYDRAKSAGVDDATLGAKFGSPPPIHISPDIAWRPNAKKTLEPLVTPLRAKVEWVDGVVASTAPAAGGKVTVKFADSISKYDETSCTPTRFIERIERDGHVVYRQNCKYVRTQTVRTSTAPVTLPADEAKVVKKGNKILVVVEKGPRSGLLVKTYPTDQTRTPSFVRTYPVKG